MLCFWDFFREILVTGPGYCCFSTGHPRERYGEIR